MSVEGLTPELFNIGMRIVDKLNGSSDDFWGYLEEHYEGRDLTNAEQLIIAKFFDTKLGKCVECEYYCPLGELQGEVEGGTCFSCGGPKT